MPHIQPLFNLKRQVVFKRLAFGFCCLILFIGLLSVVANPTHAYAATYTPHASWGCENNPVNINGGTAYACITLAQPCLRERDLISFAVVGCLPYGTTIDVFGQYAFPARVANGSDIWDEMTSGPIVSDSYVNTSNFNASSPPIPSCQVIGGAGWIGGSCSS